MTDKDKNGVEPLSNYDIINKLSNEIKERTNIIDTTRNLNNFNTAEDLFKHRGHFVMFLPSDDPKSNVGHWTVCVRQKNADRNKKDKCIIFDSYGDPLKVNRIKQILKDTYRTVEENKTRYQDYGTNPCGYWCILIIILNKLIPNLNLEKIDKFLKSKPKNMSYDLFISKLTEAID